MLVTGRGTRAALAARAFVFVVALFSGDAGVILDGVWNLGIIDVKKGLALLAFPLYDGNDRWYDVFLVLVQMAGT